MRLFLFAILGLITSVSQVAAQDITLDTVILKNGTEFVGSILEIRSDDRLSIKLENKVTLLLEMSEIEVIKKAEDERFNEILKLRDTAKVDLDQQMRNMEGFKIQLIDKVYLHDGSIVKGKIKEYVKGELLTIKTKDGIEAVIREEEIKKIVQELPPKALSNYRKKFRERKEYRFREKGLYAYSYFNALNGKSTEMGLSPGLGLGQSVGYLFRKELGFGGGVAYQRYSLNKEWYTFLPVYIEARGFLQKKNVSLTYSLGLGYGIGIKEQDYNRTRTNGGIMVKPNIGYRFGAEKTGNFVFEIGYIFQNGEVEVDDLVLGELEIRNLEFRRFVILFGFLF